MSEEAGEYKTGREPVPQSDQIPAAQPQHSELIEHQAEAWCHVVEDLMLDHGLTSTEPGKVAVEQVRNFLKRTFTSLDFYKRRCQELQRVQSMMRDPERKMVCDILANGTTYMKGMQ